MTKTKPLLRSFYLHKQFFYNHQYYCQCFPELLTAPLNIIVLLIYFPQLASYLVILFYFELAQYSFCIDKSNMTTDSTKHISQESYYPYFDSLLFNCSNCKLLHSITTTNAIIKTVIKQIRNSFIHARSPMCIYFIHSLTWTDTKSV